MNPKINPAKLTPEQRDKLEVYARAEAQLQTINDIASMTQEVVNILDDQKNDKKVDNLGVLLTDIRESLTAMKDKEDPETPDFSKPTVDAVKELQKELTKAISKIDTKPQIKVDAPAVNVSPPSVDLKGVERAVDKLSGSFKDAIKLIKIPENDDSALTEIMSNVLDQLSSIDKGVRTKPQAPNTIKVTNPDGTNVGGGKLVTVPFDYVGVAYPNSTTETYTYKTGGSGGTTVATVTVVYTDATKANISTITRS